MYVPSVFLIKLVLPPDVSVLTAVSDSLPTIVAGDTSYKCVSPNNLSELSMDSEEGIKTVNSSSEHSNRPGEDIVHHPSTTVLDSRDGAILSLVHSMLDTDESLLDPSMQVHRDYLNMKHFLEYALSNASPSTFQPVLKYSEFISNSMYLTPLPPRKSSLEQFMQTVTPKQMV